MPTAIEERKGQIMTPVEWFIALNFAFGCWFGHHAEVVHEENQRVRFEVVSVTPSQK